MFDDRTSSEAHLGFLLLRDGHAVPLADISPLAIKQGAKHRVPHPDAEPLKHRKTLTAIVGRLGFRGDFGDYQHDGWPAFQAFLREHNCTDPAGLFPADHGGCIDLYFRHVFGPTRRQLADRVFESGGPAPKRVFLGCGVNWGLWDRGGGFEAPEAAIATIGGNPVTARQRASDLFKGRHDLWGQWGFIDDKLIDGPVDHVINKSYWPIGHSDLEKSEAHKRVVSAVLAFRAVFDASPEGWVDVLPYNDRLIILRAHDGAWDVLWRSYRAEDPPVPEDVGEAYDLALEDLPSGLATESDQLQVVHFRQQVWEEREAHEAEQAFYDRGGSARERRDISSADVRVRWLRDNGTLPSLPRATWSGDLPPGFRAINVLGRSLAVSEFVDVRSFRRMLRQTDYLSRRAPVCSPWDRANEGVPDASPVGATWSDAQAFCAWQEREFGCLVRLPRRAELRAIRPIIERTAAGDEGHVELPSAVAWSEPRFHDPGPNQRKRWISDFPPRAPWREDLPWAEYAGLRFIDAWDAFEWCQESGWISGRSWEGVIASHSWGAYKNVKVTFRLVLELGE